MSTVPDVIRLMAEPLRAQIIDILACTCHLVADTGAKQPSVSGRLRLLRAAGLVTAEPYGRYTFYRLEAAGLEAAAGRLSALADRARANHHAIRREC